MTREKAKSLIGLLLVWVGVAAGQGSTGASVLNVDLAVPFGTVAGKLLLRGDYLVFWDEQEPESSFVVAKSQMENVTVADMEITVQLREAVRNRSGEVMRLVFRAMPGVEAGVVRSWFAGGMRAAAPAAGASGGVEGKSYEAQHSHRLGECRGRLIVGDDQINYESVSASSHSRRWLFKEIREIKQPNPYRLDIRPFTEAGYSLRLVGTGMEPEDFKALVDRITAARAGR